MTDTITRYLLLLLAVVWLTAPGGAGAAEPQICLRMVWTGDAALLEPLKPENLPEGQNFVDRAAELVKANPQDMRLSFSCLDRTKIDPEVLSRAAGLEMGRASAPFELGGGWAVVQLSSKSFGLEGKALFLQGRYDQAEPLLKKDLELNPDAVSSLHMLGLCEVTKNNHQQAVAYFDRALELMPRNPAIIGDKASSVLALGREDEAISLYHKALAINSENPVVLNNLAWVLAKRGKEMARAESLARRAVSLAPDKAALWVTQGEILAARGKHAEAVVSLHRALELNPQEPETRRRLLDSLQKLSPETVSRLAALPTPTATDKKPEAKRTPRPKATAKAIPAPKAKPKPQAVKPKPTPRPVAKPKATSTPVAKATAPPAPESTVTPKLKLPEKGYFLQVASLRQQSEAELILKKWNKRGYKGRLELWQSTKLGSWHRVLLGPYLTKADAVKEADRLMRQGFVKDYVLWSRKI